MSSNSSPPVTLRAQRRGDTAPSAPSPTPSGTPPPPFWGPPPGRPALTGRTRGSGSPPPRCCRGAALWGQGRAEGTAGGARPPPRVTQHALYGDTRCVPSSTQPALSVPKASPRHPAAPTCPYMSPSTSSGGTSCVTKRHQVSPGVHKCHPAAPRCHPEIPGCHLVPPSSTQVPPGLSPSATLVTTSVTQQSPGAAPHHRLPPGVPSSSPRCHPASPRVPPCATQLSAGATWCP